jgi:hypothetical protein
MLIGVAMFYDHGGVSACDSITATGTAVGPVCRDYSSALCGDRAASAADASSICSWPRRRPALIIIASSILP